MNWVLRTTSASFPFLPTQSSLIETEINYILTRDSRHTPKRGLDNSSAWLQPLVKSWHTFRVYFQSFIIGGIRGKKRHKDTRCRRLLDKASSTPNNYTSIAYCSNVNWQYSFPCTKIQPEFWI